MERMFSALGIKSTVSLKQWINAMSIFLRCSLSQKIKFCFEVYDISGNNEIRREHMVNLMRKFVYKHHKEGVEEAVKGLVEIIVTKMDLDKDGIISYDDYETTVTKDPMTLECFGQCIPDNTHLQAYLMTFTNKIKMK